MKLNPATRTRILIDVVLDVDPAGSTVELKVDDGWCPAAWLGDATTNAQNGATRWRRTARTTGFFAGPDADGLDVGTLVLDLGRHPTKTRVVLDGDQLVADADPIDVR